MTLLINIFPAQKRLGFSGFLGDCSFGVSHETTNINASRIPEIIGGQVIRSIGIAENGEYVAAALISESFYANVYQMFVDNLYVTPSARGRGLCDQLTSVLIEVWRERVLDLPSQTRHLSEISCEAASPGGERIRQKLERAVREQNERFLRSEEIPLF